MSDNGYPRVLDKEGCLYGQQIAKDVSRLCKKFDTLTEKVDKLASRLTGAAIAFGSAAILLAINIGVSLISKGVLK